MFATELERRSEKKSLSECNHYANIKKNFSQDETQHFEILFAGNEIRRKREEQM